MFYLSQISFPFSISLNDGWTVAGAGLGGHIYSLVATGNDIDLDVQAVAGVWSAAGSGTFSWGTSGNWQGGIAPNAVGDTALFGTAVGSGTATITLGSAQTVSGLTFSPGAGGSYALSGSGGNSLQLANGGSSASISVTAGSNAINAPVVLENNVNVTAASGSGLTISGAIGQSGGSQALTLSGSGSLTLSGNDSYTGGTTVNGGTLAVDNTAGSGTGSGPVAINGTGTLSGNGTIGGATSINSGGVLAPGNGGIGTLAIDNTLSLAGGAAMAMEIDEATSAADLVQGLSTVTYGGTLSVTNLAGTLASGNTFTLFSASSYAGTFTTFNLPALPAGLIWNTSKLTVNGSISVVNVTTLTTTGVSGVYGGTTTTMATLTASGSPVANETISFSLDGISLGTATTNASGVATLNGISLSGYNAGTYTSYLVASFAGDTNYASGSTLANLVVNPAALTITASPQSKTYGVGLNLGTAAFTTTGLLNSDSVTGVNLTSPGAAATAAVSGSPYTITPSAAAGTGLGNYTITYATGLLTVNPAALTITASPQSTTYGVGLNLGTTAFTTTGLLNSDSVTGVTLTSPGAAATAAVSGSPYTITPSAATGTGLGNYTITYATGLLTVSPAALTITASPQSKTYGVGLNLGTTAFTTTGLVNSDSVTGVTLASPGAAATAAVSGSPYTITPSAATGTGLGNYTITYDTGLLTVSPAALTITASPQSTTYGVGLNLGTTAFTTTGLVNSDSVTGVTLASPGAAATAAVSGSPYTITPSAATGTGLGNYTITYATGLLTVSPAALTITASPQSKTYGVGLNLGTTAFTTTGLVNSDSVTGVTLASPGAAATAAVSGSPYTITPSAATGTGLGNYTITYDTGLLTVSPAALTITASPQDKTYGVGLNLGTTAFTTAGLVNSDSVTGVTLASSGATATADVSGSPYAITPSAATGTGLGNYTITYDTGSLTVNPAALTITADNKTMDCGAAVPSLTASYSGFVNGDTSASLTTPPTLTTTATSASPAGSYDIDVSGAADPNYNITYVTGTLTVIPVATIAAWSSGVDGPWNSTTDWTDTQGIGAPGFSGVSGDQATFNGAGGLNVDLGNFSPSIAGLSFGPGALNYDIKSTGSGLLQLNNGSSSATITVSAGSQTIDTPVVLGNNVNVTVAGGGGLTISGAIGQSGGSQALTLSGSGSLTLSGNNNYGGGTTVNGGTLFVTSSSALLSGTALTVGADGTVVFGSSVEAATQTATRTTRPTNDVSGATAAVNSASPAVPTLVLLVPTATDVPASGSMATTGSSSVTDSGSLVSSSATVVTPPVASLPPTLASGPQTIDPGKSVPVVLATCPVNRFVRPSTAERFAADLVWLEQTVNSQVTSDQQCKKDISILAVDAVFARNGQ